MSKLPKENQDGGKTIYAFFAHFGKQGGFFELVRSLGQMCDGQMDSLDITDEKRREELRTLFVKDKIKSHLFAKELKKRAESSIQIFLPREWHAPIIEEQDVMKSLEQRNALISAFVQQNLPEIDVSQNVDLVVSAIESQDAMLLQFEY